MTIGFTCPHCGHATEVAQQYAGRSGPCRQCGQPITIPGASDRFNAPPAQSDLGESAAIRMLIPVGRSGWAIAAGYLGLFSVLFFPAPLALFFGIMAIRDIRHHPHRHGMGRAIFGLVMGIIFTIPLLIFLVSILANFRSFFH